MSNDIKLPSEDVDHIILKGLIQHRSLLQEELNQYENGEWLHEDDVRDNKKLIRSMTRLIRYYGGE